MISTGISAMREGWLIFLIYAMNILTYFSCSKDASNNFVLQDIQGRPKAVSLANEGGLTVVAFMSPECPLCAYYAGPLNQMYADFADRGVEFFAVFSDTLYTAGEIDAFLSEYGVKWQVLLDPFNQLRNEIQATVTPQVFVFDSAGLLVYSGAIDDWAVTVRKHRQVVRHRYLRNAIEAVLEGRAVDTASTDPVGCLMQ